MQMHLCFAASLGCLNGSALEIFSLREVWPPSPFVLSLVCKGTRVLLAIALNALFVSSKVMNATLG